MPELLVVSTTTPDRPIAERIAAALVDQRLAACVQISGPILSVYRWEGRVEQSEEWLCTAKTTAARWDDIERLVRELHPYDTPELIAVPIHRASAAYRGWVVAETS